MAKNYFIGIGGTGARVAEALVHVCAAGYGPDELSLFLIDPDSGNGNLNRTVKRIGKYQSCRKDFERLDAEHVPLFHTDLKTPDDPKDLTWGVLSKDATLEAEVGLSSLSHNENPPLADFIRVLYTDQELQTELDEGFRGHPSIGSALMADLNQAASKDPWRMFWKDVKEAPGKSGAIRVFLAGSVFGGTGAAGVPTLGHPDVIKRHKDATIDDGRSKVLLGSALALPYFTIGAPSVSSQETDRMHVTKNDFPVATKAALQYYEDCIERDDLAFDQLYLIGDSGDQKVGEFSAGADEQKNDPHYVEVVTALASVDFFEQANDEDTSAGKQHFTARREDTVVRWDGLPFSRDPNNVRANRNTFERLMKTMTVFCYLLHTYGEDTLSSAASGDVYASWYNDHFSSNFVGRLFSDQSKEHLDPTSKENEDARKNIVEYANNFLAWIAAMDDSRVALVNRSLLIEEGSADHVTLRDPQQYEDNLAGLFGDENERGNFGAFRQKLDEVQVEDKNLSGAERYVKLFYLAARRFSDENYNLQA